MPDSPEITLSGLVVGPYKVWEMAGHVAIDPQYPPPAEGVYNPAVANWAAATVNAARAGYHPDSVPALPAANQERGSAIRLPDAAAIVALGMLAANYPLNAPAEML